MNQRSRGSWWTRCSSAVTLGLALALGGCASAGGLGGGGGQALFNGTDLSGWNGDPRYWRVEDGVIVGETTPDNPLHANTFLRWEGEPLRDFTLRLRYRMHGGNSGVQYRSKVLGGWTVGGYQADIDARNTYTGMLYEEQGRGIVARRGQQVVIEPDGDFNVVGSVGDPDELAARIRTGDWNTLEITMRGNHIVHRINGRVTVDVVDDQPEMRADSGILALQIHTGPPMKIEFKDIVLTRLSPTSPAR